MQDLQRSAADRYANKGLIRKLDANFVIPFFQKHPTPRTPIPVSVANKGLTALWSVSVANKGLSGWLKNY